MLDTEPTTGPSDPTTDHTTDPLAAGAPRRRRGASRPAGPPQVSPDDSAPARGAAEDTPAPAKKAARRRAGKKTAAEPAGASGAGDAQASEIAAGDVASADSAAPAKKSATRKAASKKAATTPATKTTKTTKSAARKSTKKAAAAPDSEPSADTPSTDTESVPEAPAHTAPAAGSIAALLFRPPDEAAAAAAPKRRRAAAKTAPAVEEPTPDADEPAARAAEGSEEDSEDAGSRRRRRGGRGRRGRGRGSEGAEETTDDAEPAEAPTETAADADEGEAGSSPRRRRRRRRAEGDEDGPRPDDPPNTVVRVRERRPANRDDEVRSVKGSVRLEAKKQRRRDGRESGRRRSTVITEAEFLARRESVDREMLVRQVGDRTQIAVIEDDVLVEHHVTSASATGLVGNVYLGRVQNVLPSMEAAFIDVGRGRNAVLYAGEVNWDAAGLEGQPKRIEFALKSGDSVLVQVTKDPIGHKGARLTSQVSLPGRFLVYVPGGSMTGISRKLPDTERTRLKSILKQIVPEDAGVIVRTAAEGASEEELSRDVARLQAQWEDIEKKAKTASAPALLYAEPDLAIRVVRDIFNEDFAKLVVSGDDAWDTIQPYLSHVAPDLADRLSRWTQEDDIFAARRVDEQLTKALDRKVWLPSGGYLVIDRTEAMVVVDVNTGKFTGSGGDLEETVTRNNLEAAEEVVHQLRLRDLGGIIVIDFIDMVIESNRDLVLRRLLECLGRDRTKHQVAEVTSLGLVQMTRKRVGQGLFEVFSTTCECCNGRGVHVSLDPVEAKPEPDQGGRDRDRDRSRDRARRSTSAEGADESHAEEREPKRGRGSGRKRAASKRSAPEPVAAV